MKIYILNDNVANNGFKAEHGLSYFIEANGRKMLFDTGPSDVFLRNAKKQKIDPDEAEIIALSHGHWDHTNGLAEKNRGKTLEGKPLLAHPDTFIYRYSLRRYAHHGAPITEDEANAHFNLIYSREPYKIDEGIIFLGEIPRRTSFESSKVLAIKSDRQNDYIKDDTAIAVIEQNKLHIVTGCSHSGIINIANYAKEITGFSQIETIIGGFHLQGSGMQTIETINHLEKLRVPNLYPSHCTMDPALTMLRERVPCGEVKSGDVLEF